MVDSYRNFEIYFLNYLRTSITDPSGRGTAKTDTLTAAASPTFTLTQTLVKQITSVTVNGVAKYIGYDYTVSLGEGTAASTITLVTTPTPGDTVVVVYRYGTSMIYEGFARVDSELPRISVISLGLVPEMMSIGEQSDGTGKWIYLEGSYMLELRSRFSSQLKTMLSDVFNKVNQFRQLTPQPYKVVISRVTNINPMDFDQEIRVYRAQVNVTVKWMVQFQ